MNKLKGGTSKAKSADFDLLFFPKKIDMIFIIISIGIPQNKKEFYFY